MRLLCRHLSSTVDVPWCCCAGVAGGSVCAAAGGGDGGVEAHTARRLAVAAGPEPQAAGAPRRRPLLSAGTLIGSAVHTLTGSARFMSPERLSWWPWVMIFDTVAGCRRLSSGGSWASLSWTRSTRQVRRTYQAPAPVTNCRPALPSLWRSRTGFLERSLKRCQWRAGSSKGPAGEFVRPESRLRSQVTADGSGEFPAEAGRYHLFIANNCPWCG